MRHVPSGSVKHTPASPSSMSATSRLVAPAAARETSSGTGIAVGFAFRTNSRAFKTVENSFKGIVLSQQRTGTRNQLHVVRSIAAERSTGDHGKNLVGDRFVARHVPHDLSVRLRM